MLGAIVGDFCGAPYERRGARYDGSVPLINAVCRLTDDSILTFATAEVLLGSDLSAEAFARSYMSWGRDYPNRGYGSGFSAWLGAGQLVKNGSFGNGSAMRVSPAGWAARSLEESLALAEKSALYTHGHPEGVKGAQAIAGSVFLLRQGEDNARLSRWIESAFGYDLSRSVSQLIAEGCGFNATCQGSVPQAVRCFLDAGSYEEAISNACSLNGDTDTQADMAGALAQARWGVPWAMRLAVQDAMDDRMKSTLHAFEERFGGAF